MRKLLPLALLICFAGCHKDPPLWEVNNLEYQNQIVILGHGGMGIESLWPMDSQESLTEAIDMGANGTEMDVQVSNDGVLFLHHNLDLSEASKCDGKIWNMNADEISCEYKSIAHPGLKVRRLEEFLSAIKITDNMTLTFDCKLGDSNQEYLQKFSKALQDIVKRFKIENNCLIESTDPEFLSVLRKANPQLRLYIYTPDFETALKIAEEHKLYGITMDMFKISSDQIKLAHNKGFHVSIFGQRTEDDNIKAVQMSPDCIQTDELKHLLKVFEMYKD